MKYTLLLLTVISLASCKKTYYCNCYTGSGEKIENAIQWEGSKKSVSDAEKHCDFKEVSTRIEYSDTAAYCTLN